MEKIELQKKLFINGEFVNAKSNKVFPVINPFDESVITEVAEGDKEDIDLAVKSATDALEGEWKEIGPHGRQKLLLKLADLWDKHADELGTLESFNNGTPISQQKECVAGLAEEIRYHAGWATKCYDGRTVEVSGPYEVKVVKEPIGVCGFIIPWNLPLWCLIVKLAPCLACGNTVVCKPAEQTPLTALKAAELMKEVGFPPGVINIVPGFGPTAGQALAMHLDVQKIAFTGSSEVGKLIMQYSGKSNLKRVQLELGGKSPLVIAPDADVEKAVKIAGFAVFGNNGEQCDAGSRTFVHESMYDEFVKLAVEHANNMIVGNPMDEKTDQGPLVDKAQYKKVLEYIEIGKKDGAKFECGGEMKKTFEKGYFIKPVVFSNVTDEMRIAKEEIFGPVQSIIKYSNFDDVIKRANNTPYGLASGIVTNSMTKALKYSKEIKAGFVWINTWFQMFPEVEFGGFKQSGFGKDGGAGAYSEWLLTKAVVKDCSE
eukprot:gene2189-2053_t